MVAQYDPCGGALKMDPMVYIMGLVGITLTATCSVVNTNVLKTYSGISMHVINMSMYFVGTIANFATHQYMSDKKMFENYNEYAVMVIVCNSLLGVAVTFVYKYADAIIKTLAQSLNICSLLLFGPVLFGSSVSLMEFIGISIVCISTYIYVSSSIEKVKHSLPK